MNCRITVTSRDGTSLTTDFFAKTNEQAWYAKRELEEYAAKHTAVELVAHGYHIKPHVSVAA